MRGRDAVGAERGDVERTREANNPNFIVGDLHSESHYQTSVPRARYNYAGVAQQKCIELPRFLSLHFSLILLSCLFSSRHSGLLSLLSLSVLTFFICTRFAPITCSNLYARLFVRPFRFLFERLLIT